MGVWLLAAGTLGWLLAANDTKTAVHAAPWLFLVCWFGGLPSNERISQLATKTGRNAIVVARHDARFS